MTGATGSAIPSLAMLTPAEQAQRAPADLLDVDALAADLDKLCKQHAGNERELRTALAQRLKAALLQGRATAEKLLLADRHGRRCAERLCHMQDEIIRLLFELAEKHLYPSQNTSEAEQMAVVATGGYGRGLLAPGSDIDLLFLLPYKQTAWGESVAETILYCLWDMGLKVGHATRSINECVRQAKADITIRTAVLEARYLFGDRKLFDEMVARFDKDVAQGTAPEFVAAKLAEREERHRRAGQSRYLVEPNVKDGKGGLRDLHTLFWIAKYVYRVREPEELIEKGVFNRAEYMLFRRCEDFLWSVRCHMHFVTGRAEERLSFDIQREIAVRLGYTSHPGLRDVERFMKHYFLIAKDVGDLTAILCAELEDSQAKAMPVLSAHDGAVPPVEAALAQRDRGFHRRLQPHPGRRPDRVQARSGQPDPHLPSGAEIQSRVPPRRDARHPPFAAPHRQRPARERGGQPPVPRDPDLEERRRDRAAPHERSRRARQVRAHLRPHRGDDAVQHVSPLYGRRASPALHRHPLRHRGRPRRGRAVRHRADAHDPAGASHPALYGAVPARHRQGPDRGPFHRRRTGGAAAVPALRALAGRDRHRRLAGRAAPHDVDGRPVTRPLRPGHHPEFLRGRAIGRAAEAFDPAHGRRHQGRRPRRLERLEGAAHPHAVLRDRAGADRRLLGSEPRPARRRGAGGAARRSLPIGRPSRSRPMSPATIRPTG